MKTLCTAIACMMSGLITPVFAGEIQQSESCVGVGRVIESHDSGIPMYSKLCADGILIVGDRLKVKVSCYGQANNRWIQGGRYSIEKLCSENRSARSACWFVDCERSPGKVSLLSPRSSTVLGTPHLEWSLVEGATFYEIRVSSHTGRTMQAKTQGTRYQLSETYRFKPGESYEIKIFATTADSILSENIFSLRVPGNEEIHELEESLTRIENSNIPELAKTQLVDSAYLSFGLIEHSIEYLEKKFARTNNTQVAALIADRYAEIGDPNKAKKHYEIVVQRKSTTSEEFKFAKTMLARIAALENPKANSQ